MFLESPFAAPRAASVPAPIRPGFEAAPRRRAFGLAACIALFAGCGGPERVEDPYGHGTLEMRVRRAPSEVEFRVDGRRLHSQSNDSSWREALCIVSLPPGAHTVEARFSIGSFERETLWSTITTVAPVRIVQGRRTVLDADLQGWRTDPPEERVHYFHVQEPAIAAATPDGGPSTNVVPMAAGSSSEASAEELERQIRSEPAVPLVISPATRPAPADAGSPAAVQPSNPVAVALEITSVPEGAIVRIGDAEVGRTPLTLRIDPRLDHVIQVQREGCAPIVQLLGADAWRTGRTPKVSFQLDCQ